MEINDKLMKNATNTVLNTTSDNDGQVEIRLASGILYDSVVDGNGLRMVVFTQGCFHNCTGCHNKSSHDTQGGKVYKLKDIFNDIDNNLYHDGVTISGGEPFLQPNECNLIAKHAKSKGLNVWVYTGFTLEQLLKDDKYTSLLANIDILVDGKFEESLMHKKGVTGSSNQRVIDLNKYR